MNGNINIKIKRTLIGAGVVTMFAASAIFAMARMPSPHVDYIIRDQAGKQEYFCSENIFDNSRQDIAALTGLDPERFVIRVDPAVDIGCRPGRDAQIYALQDGSLVDTGLSARFGFTQPPAYTGFMEVSDSQGQFRFAAIP